MSEGMILVAMGPLAKGLGSWPRNSDRMNWSCQLWTTGRTSCVESTKTRTKDINPRVGRYSREPQELVANVPIKNLQNPLFGHFNTVYDTAGDNRDPRSSGLPTSIVMSLIIVIS